MKVKGVRLYGADDILRKNLNSRIRGKRYEFIRRTDRFKFFSGNQSVWLSL
mgnify:CR=1 FL=1